MKPRNDKERLIMELSEKLPKITEKQIQWAKDTCFEKVGYYSAGLVWCSQCGKLHKKISSELGISLVGDKTVCPHCHAKLKLKNSRKCSMKEKWYFTILTTCKGYQVCRHFIISKQMFKVNNNINVDLEYRIYEAVQNWISPDGKETIIARSCVCMPHYYDMWNFSEPMSIKRRSNYDSEKYDINAQYLYPHRSILPILRRNGFTLRCKTLAPNLIMKLLLTDREAEMLIKNRQYKLLYYKDIRGYKEFCMPYSHAIRIANKNKYIVKDHTMWFDYLDLLAFFHKDTHNSHYVCPKNLEKEHDKLVAKKKIIDEQIELRKKRKDMEKWEKRYKEEKAKFLNLCFSNGDIVVKPIQSVLEMAEEGDKMHHCVYAMGYYQRKDSLILSAKKVDDGTRIETIEVSLKTYKLIQSRGVCNSNTQYHDKIINLIKSHMPDIQRANKII